MTGFEIGVWESRQPLRSGPWETTLTYRIRRSEGPEGTVFAVSGDMDTEHAARLEELLDELPYGSVLLDLKEVTLVAREAVQFLGRAEARGVRIAHCPDYVRSWIAVERGAPSKISH